ncbi:MAG: hypothetical protein KC593_20190 [Myxococcales bacterium]|nr:hypothetical protein [Myxococcales bacterium]
MRRLFHDLIRFALARRGILLPILIAILLIASLAFFAEGAALAPLVYPLF